MPRQAATKVYANFTGGLVTEANKLSYPENAAIDIDNLDINENGSVQRRAGLAYDGTVTKALPSTSNPIATTATTVHKWKAVNGNPSLNIAIIQVADRLDFYYIGDAELLSATPAAASITLGNTSRPSASTAILRQTTPISVVSGGGRVFIVGKYIDPFSLDFTEPAVAWDTGTLVKTDIILKIRDFEVIKDDITFESGGTTYSVSGNKRQDYMSGAHFYNLANQGWPSEEVDKVVPPYGTLKEINEANAVCSSSSDPGVGTTTKDPAEYTYTRSGIGFFPTTQDLFHSNQAGGGSTVSQQIAYSPWTLQNDYTGTTESPRGKFIKEAFFIDRQAVGKYGAASATGDFLANYELNEQISAQFRPSTVAFYAGRVWYAGLEGTKYTNNLYYSQVVGDRVSKASKCYQEADPTAEVINELVATDGGVLGLEEVGKIYKMAPIGPSLVVIADNGVWVVSGDGEFSSFRADTFSVRKVTDQGAINTSSIVFAKDTIFYWGETALVAVLTGQGVGIVAQDISSATIKSLYQQTTTFAKQGTFSIFDEGANRILWFYEDGLDSTYDDLIGKAFNKVLYFDVSLGAFGKYSLSIQPEVLPVFATNAEIFTTLTIVDPVTDGGVVVTAGGDPVSTTTSKFIPERSSIKLLTLTGDAIGGYSYRFSDFRDVTTFKDWGNNFSSYIEGGFDSVGDIVGRGKKALLLQTHFERTETGFTQPDPLVNELTLDNPSSCIARYGWDWSESPYSNPFQVYKLLKNYTPLNVDDDYIYDRSVVSTRNRLRGRGTSLGLRFESETGKDFRLLGYGVVYTGRDRP